MFYIIFDLIMAIIFFGLGIYFYTSKGKGIRFLTGYSKTIKSKDYEVYLCKRYGKKIISWGLVFIIGGCIDAFYEGIGCLFAWAVWFVMFILLLVERSKKEK